MFNGIRTIIAVMHKLSTHFRRGLPQTVIDFLHSDVTNFLEARPLLIDMTDFITAKTRVTKVRDAVEILSARLRNQRLA